SLAQHTHPPRPQTSLLWFGHRVSGVENPRPTKTLLTLPALRTHRTRPQGLGNYRTVSTSANSAHPLFEKEPNPNRRELRLSTVSRDFTVQGSWFKVQGCVTGSARARSGAPDVRGAADPRRSPPRCPNRARSAPRRSPRCWSPRRRGS